MFAKMKQLSLTKGELKKITHLRINKKFRNYYCIKVSSTRQGYSIFAKSSTTPVFANLVRNTFADPSSPSIVPSLSKVPSIGELHLYLACPHHLTKSTNIQKHLSLLSSEELQDLDTSHTKDVYRSRLLTRSLARSVLASYLPQPATHPEDLQFSKGQFGKPRLAAPLDGVSFNLSHSPSLICCAVASPALEVGVDVESSRRQFGRNGPLKLARRWLSAEEVERLEGLGLAEQQIQFLQLWTVKEACVKAAGTGISGSPLNSFSLQMLARNPSYLRETAQVSKLHTVPEIVSISLSRQGEKLPGYGYNFLLLEVDGCHLVAMSTCSHQLAQSSLHTPPVIHKLKIWTFTPEMELIPLDEVSKKIRILGSSSPSNVL